MAVHQPDAQPSFVQEDVNEVLELLRVEVEAGNLRGLSHRGAEIGLLPPGIGNAFANHLRRVSDLHEPPALLQLCQFRRCGQCLQN